MKVNVLADVLAVHQFSDLRSQRGCFEFQLEKLYSSLITRYFQEQMKGKHVCFYLQECFLLPIC